MGYTPHFISSFEDDSGQYTYYEPFLIPEKAFPVLQDAWCFRGKVIKKQGYKLIGRLQRDLTALSGTWNITSPGAGVVVSNVFTGLGLAATEPHAQILPGTLAAPNIINIGGAIGETLTDQHSNGVLDVAPGVAITAASLNYSTGEITMTFSGAYGASATTFTGSYYPCLPVMGLRTRETTLVNEEDTIEFDRKYAYYYDYGAHRFRELTPGTTWHGTDSELFWTTNYWKTAAGNKIFWATNTHMSGATRDPMRFHDTLTWTPFAPLTTATETLYNAYIILPYHDRLLMINTWEGTTVGTITAATNNQQTIRWSMQGNVLDANAFRTDLVGYGGFLNIPTSEVIVGAAFIKDTLLIKCERSSWKLVYTNNEALPFIAQKINTELGSESRFSLVPFDKGVYAVGNYGITTDDSVNVERIDLQIPNTIFDFNNDKQGTSRICGIRDFYHETVYWNYPKSAQNPTFPNNVLLYNYRNETYATLTDSFTTFGYFQNINDQTWADLSGFTCAQWQAAWNAGLTQSFFPEIIAGTQHGFVEMIMQDDQYLNDPSLYISAVDFTLPMPQFTIPNHNLQSGDIVSLKGVIGEPGIGTDPALLNDHTYLISKISDNIITLQYYDVTIHYPFNPFIDIISAGFANPASVYIGGGVVRKYNNFKIATKVFSPFYEAGNQCRIGYIDFFLTKTDTGQFTSDVYVNENDTQSVTNQRFVQNGTNVVRTGPENLALLPSQAAQKKIWHRQFVGAVSQNFQVVMTLSPEQNANIAFYAQAFELHALSFYLSPNARLTQ
jgi:hypothetical protein